MTLQRAIEVSRSYIRWRTGFDKRNQTDWLREENITLADISVAIGVLIINAETSLNEMDDGK